MTSLQKLVMSCLLAGTVLGCGDSGNRVVDTSGADVPVRTAKEAQKEAESDLPKP